MQASAESVTPGFQSQFHQRWNHLDDPHVRSLAWLLDAPDLLDPHAPQWRGRIATLGALDEDARDWLAGLDKAPQSLSDYLALQPFTRLGRYAERLMAFYLEHCGSLFAHGVQVRAAKNETIGEFDFLLREGGALVHWEFATKLYLLESIGHGHHADYFVGPNLADTLGAKVRKIMDRQLSLSQHPAAQQHLPMPIAAAQALVKGWLFYHGKTPLPALPAGISRAHCRGFWCALNELDHVSASRYKLLPRLSWLAPAKTAGDDVLDRDGLIAALSMHFDNAGTPALVALMEAQDGHWLETDRGFIVPDDWRSRAESRVKRID
jgi:hypothetical protein